jgi:hypothetical protein
MAGARVAAEAARAGLAAPVERGHPPPARRPVSERLEVFLVVVAAPGKEQQRAAGIVGRGKVEPADGVPVGRDPAAFARIAGNRAAIETGPRWWMWLDNPDLPPIVTFW